MKYIPVLILLFFSCAPSKEEASISDYVQTAGDTKTDLDFSLEELIFNRDFLGIDSVDLILSESYNINEPINSKNRIEFINHHRRVVKRLKTERSKFQHQLDSLRGYKKYDHHYELLYLQMLISLEKSLKRDTVILSRIERNLSDSSRVVAKKFKTIYKIRNPSMNYVEQEVRKSFYLTPDGLSVIAVE